MNEKINVNHNEQKKYLIVMSVFYIALFFATLSDVLRIENTAITLFRLMLPICILIIGMFPYWMKWFLGIIGGFTILTLVQYYLFYKIIRPELTFSKNILLKFMIFYAIIIIVFFMVKIVQQCETKNFEKVFSNFIIFLGVALLAVGYLNVMNPQMFKDTPIDNINNYGCYMAALFPFLIVKFQEKTSLFTGLLMVATLALVVLNDSKAALLGIVIQIAVFLCIAFRADTRYKMFAYRYGALIVFGGGLLVLFLINPNIHEYTLRGFIFEPINRIISNTPYPVYTTSIMYRTNTTIFALWEVIRTGAFGLGAGNTGVALKAEFPNLNKEYLQALNAPTLSLHNAWLEFILDVGLIALIVFIIVIVYGLKEYFTRKEFTQIGKIRMLFIFSFPLWVLGASGIYTQYYLMIVIAFLVFANEKKKVFGRCKV